MASKRQILTLAVVVLLLLLGLGAWLMWRTLHRVEQAATLTKQEEEADLGSVMTRVRSLARLETASMHVANVSTLKQGYNLLPDKFAGDEITFFASGDVIAGVDLSTIQQRDVWREPDGTLVMRLPPPTLLVSRSDNRESHVINRRTGIFRSADQGLEGRARQRPGHADRVHQRLRLVHRLVVLRRGIGVVDDAGARLDVRAAVREDV